MSNKVDTTNMKTKREAKPNLRFPDFRDAGGWEEKPLQDICNRVVDRVGDALLTPVSITAGYGFVSQESKFGRDISGAQYRNYIFLRRGDFAYNRGNSKRYPQGYVCQLKEFDQAAASTAFLCFRLKNEYEAGFIQGLFDTNIHGKQLAKYITSSARSDGLLNINPEVFFSIILPIPSYKEQQKIADCLSSLDELITAEAQKLDALKAHKKGLMQQLSPPEGETLPKLRFPEFRDAGEWEERAISELASPNDKYGIVDGPFGSNLKSMHYQSEGVPIITSGYVTDGVFYADKYLYVNKEKFQEEKRSAVRAGDIVMAKIGARCGSSAIMPHDHETGILSGNALKITVDNSRFSTNFVWQVLWDSYVNGRLDVLRAVGAQPAISIANLKKHKLTLPSKEEQQKIADCLTSLDELITAEAQKLDMLKAHKTGLMQQLFPAFDEV